MGRHQQQVHRRDADRAQGGILHTPPCIPIHSTIDRPDAARLGRPRGHIEARSLRTPLPSPAAAPNAPSSTWGEKRVVAALATATRGVPQPAADTRAPLSNRTRVVATVERAAKSAVPTADNAEPPAAATVTVRVAVVPRGGGQRRARGGEWSRTIKLGEAAGRRPHAQAAGPRLPHPSYPPRCRRATEPESRPADGSAPVRALTASR